MLSPEEAYERLVKNNLEGMDDPTISWHPYRWYWYMMEDGRFCLACAAWRSYPSTYPDFIKPEQN